MEMWWLYEFMSDECFIYVKEKLCKCWTLEKGLKWAEKRKCETLVKRKWKCVKSEIKRVGELQMYGENCVVIWLGNMSDLEDFQFYPYLESLPFLFPRAFWSFITWINISQHPHTWWELLHSSFSHSSSLSHLTLLLSSLHPLIS